MVDTLDVGKRIELALKNKPVVEVGASFMSYGHAVQICKSHNLLCDYWIPSKTFVFRKLGMKTSTAALTIHEELRPNINT